MAGISYDEAERPALANLIRLYAALADSDPLSVADEMARLDKADFKARLADLHITKFADTRDYVARVSLDEVEIVLQEGAARARSVAEETWEQVRAVVGLRD